MYPNQPQQPTPPPQQPPNQGWGGSPAPAPPTNPYSPPPLAPPLPPLGSGHKKPSGPFALLFNDWMKQHWKLVLAVIFGLIILGMLIYQIVYPSGRLLPGTKVDGVAVGGLRKDEAAKKLNELYGDIALGIYFGKNDAAFLTPKLKEVGVHVVNENRINAIDYPFYYRVIPGSFLWVNSLLQPGALEYTYDKQQIQNYTQGKVGDTCTIPAKDATLKLIDSQLQLVPSEPGGVCDITKFQKALAEVRPTADETATANKVRIDSIETPAKVDDDKARQLADMLNTRLKNPMPISLGSDTQQVPGRIVLGWLDFKSDIPPENIDNSANQTAKLAFTVNKDRMADYINNGIAAKVVKKPGVSKVSTLDFKETSRVNGAGGTEIDLPKIVASITDYINSKANQAVAITKPVGPTVVYSRSYSPTSVGYQALLTQFAQDNPGTYGLAINELSGVKNLRSASYNGDTKFKSAGAENLFIGYSVLIGRNTGELLPAENIAGGKNPDTCLKDMIIRQDLACRTGFYNRLGFNSLTARGKDLGLTNTTFAEKSGITSANDLQKVLIGLYKNQIARVEGGQQLLSIGRGVRIEDGIPTGVTTGEVSHFVGESDVMHNDTAVVYSSKGVYVLTILSEGASWEKVVELTKKIEAFKQVKPPEGAR